LIIFIITLLQVQQVVAKELGVEMNLIKIKPAISNINPNGFVTGGSWGSELSCEVSFDTLIKVML